MYNARLVRQKIERQNDYIQAGETYRSLEDWEREDLIGNLVGAISQAEQHIQDKMVEMFTKCDEDYGRRVSDGLKMAARKKATNGMDKSQVGKADAAVKKVEDESNNAKPY